MPLNSSIIRIKGGGEFPGTFPKGPAGTGILEYGSGAHFTYSVLKSSIPSAVKTGCLVFTFPGIFPVVAASRKSVNVPTS